MAWPARILNIQEGGISVVFEDGQKGENAQIFDFNKENLQKFVKNGKFKKTGAHTKKMFLKQASKWGLSV